MAFRDQLNPNDITVRDENGNIVISLARSGHISALSGSFQSELTVGGIDVMDLLSDFSLRGPKVIAGTTKAPAFVNISAEYGITEIQFTTPNESREYLIAVSGLAAAWFSAGSGRINVKVRMTTDGSRPTISGGTLISRKYVWVSGETDFLVMQPYSFPANKTIRLLVSVEPETSSPQVTVYRKDWYNFAVYDVGSGISRTGVISDGGASGDPPTATYEKDLEVEWAASYGTDLTEYDYRTDRLFLGQYPGAELTRSLIGFPDQMRTDLSGADSIEWVKVYLINDHWYYGDGGTVTIGRHEYDSKPSSASSYSTDGYIPVIAPDYWERDEARWVTLPSSWDSAFASTKKGIVLYSNNPSNLRTYGYFVRHYTDPNDIEVRVKYRYVA